MQRHARIKALYLDCCELNPEQRAERLARECGDDRALRDEVQAMLDFDARHPGFLASSPIAALESIGGPEEPAPPRTIGRFRVLRKIGEGGMGTVFEVEQDRPPRNVALKLLRPGLDQGRSLRRFELEAEILGRLQHPGIARIYESGKIEADLGPRPYLLMELVRGESLTRYARRSLEGARERLELFARVCDAVQHAHQNGVIHRDLKPANILVDESGGVKILDFGIARLMDDDLHRATLLTGGGQIVGTLAYMSPEQAAGGHEAIDTRSDVYSLGVLLFEVLSGELPYEVSSGFLPQAVRTIREREPRRLSAIQPTLRGEVETIARKALEKERDRRYASAAALAADIRHFLRHEPIEARPASRMYTLRKFVRRNRILVGSALCVIAALVIGLVSSLRFAWAEARERDRAALLSREARAQAYQSGILAAHLSLEAGNWSSAIQQLDALPPESRGWEWDFLSSILHRSLVELDVPELFDAAYLDDEHVLTVDAHGSAQVWDLVSQAATPLVLMAPGARPLALSGDGRRLVSYVEGELISGSTLGQGPPSRIPFPQGQPVEGRSAVLSPDASRLALSTEDGALYLIELDPSPTVARLGEEPMSIDGLRFSPDGRWLAVGERGRVQLWDVRARALLWSLRKWNQDFSPLAFDTERGCLVSTWDAGITFHGLEDGKLVLRLSAQELGTLRVGAPICIEYDAGHSRLALKIRNGSLWLLDSASGSLLAVCEREGGRQPAKLVFSPSGSSLLTFGRTGESVRIANAELERSAVIDANCEFVNPLVVSPDGTRLATGAWDGNTRLWDAATREELAVLHSGGRVWALAFAPDGRELASGLREGGLVVWDSVAGSRLGQLEDLAADSLDYSPDGSRLAVGVAGGWLHALEAKGLEPIWSVELDDKHRRIAAARWSPDGRLLAAAGVSGFVSLRDAASGVEIARAAGTAHGSFNYTGALWLAFSPDGRHLASAWGDSSLILWDVPGLDHPRHLVGHQEEVLAVAFSPDGRRLASGGRDGILRLWDPASGGLLLSLEGHTSYIYSLAFTPDGRRIATGSGDATVRLWDSAPAAVSWREHASAKRAPARLESPPEPAAERAGEPSSFASEAHLRERSAAGAKR